MTAIPEDALDREVLVPLREYLRLIEEARGEGPLVVDSAWLSSRYGKSQEWWADRARAGDVRATQDAPGSPWYFDRASCKRHLLALLNQSKRASGGVGSRGPRSQQRDAA